MGIVVCPYCWHRNADGRDVCSRCEQSLTTPAVETKNDAEVVTPALDTNSQSLTTDDVSSDGTSNHTANATATATATATFTPVTPTSQPRTRVTKRTWVIIAVVVTMLAVVAGAISYAMSAQIPRSDEEQGALAFESAFSQGAQMLAPPTTPFGSTTQTFFRGAVPTTLAPQETSSSAPWKDPLLRENWIRYTDSGGYFQISLPSVPTRDEVTQQTLAMTRVFTPRTPDEDYVGVVQAHETQHTSTRNRLTADALREVATLTVQKYDGVISSTKEMTLGKDKAVVLSCRAHDVDLDALATEHLGVLYLIFTSPAPGHDRQELLRYVVSSFNPTNPLTSA